MYVLLILDAPSAGLCAIIRLGALARKSNQLRKPHMFLNGMQVVVIGAATDSPLKDGCFCGYQPLTVDGTGVGCPVRRLMESVLREIQHQTSARKRGGDLLVPK